MDWKPFWKVIEDAYRPDPIDHFEALKERLGALKWFEIIEFQARFDEAVSSANLIDLWGAACLINGGCSDDGFRDFRVWLVGRGRRAYEHALRDPDSLTDILDGDPVDGFGLDAAALRVYEEKTGMSDFYTRLDRAEVDSPPPPPEGADWDFEDESEMRKRFPKLCHLYLIPERDE
ncbi:hypothetical protein VT84_21925 [Gemmata sp. SH-PL17]|uniref:DUF4240 domain-containing protein n=1 Tax=Gemmata sp. SH-PL17 TaxID=1630693 RepID=UPI00078D8B71|nr:DUF4240 domain-containing protein [Gemmata sp. SH-PL17]AMV27076.1 hypothetical protein VT84_21925 [Gemmata sp. SH-PL17]